MSRVSAMSQVSASLTQTTATPACGQNHEAFSFLDSNLHYMNVNVLKVQVWVAAEVCFSFYQDDGGDLSCSQGGVSSSAEEAAAAASAHNFFVNWRDGCMGEVTLGCVCMYMLLRCRLLYKLGEQQPWRTDYWGVEELSQLETEPGTPICAP